MSAPTLPAERLLPSPTDPAWNDPATFDAIAYWQDTVNPAAHQLAHPQPVQGCPGCPPVTACLLCGLPPAACPDLAGHRRTFAAGEVLR
ncbi:hypothetical protein ACGFIY_21035 [Micromonospora chersina]|uniref:hypothetical protein n=1 Tax=Micromonospora chersina TaxID=47854 RepID=UPI003713AA4F